MKKVVVTGACGFIGSHLVNYLKQKGYYVIAVDVKPQSECFLKLKADEVYELDLRKKSSWKTIAEGKGVDYLYHLAANMGGIGYITSVGAPIMRDSTLMNMWALESCRKFDIKRIFYSSSACVYPNYKQTDSHVKPLKESDAYPADPNEYYGWEKLYMEKMMEAYSKDYGLDVRIARFHNVYGPYGTYKGGREKAPAAICRKVAMAPDGGTIEIWGDGKQTRSFLYIDDCLRGIDMLMESNYSQPLNIGSDRLVTIDELTRIVIKISGKKLAIKHDLSKPQGVRGRNADLTLIKKVLGWEPKVTLEEGLTKTYEWIKEQVMKEGGAKSVSLQ
ncbi:MAG: NAD-dependent epimerase/dehydratase family protein [Thermoproteota archaeon]